MHKFKMNINGNLDNQGTEHTIRSPYDRKAVGKVIFAGPKEAEFALDTACRAFDEISNMPVYERASVLREISKGISQCSDQLTQIIKDEAGKPIKLARAEVDRAVSTFLLAANEALNMEGAVLNLDSVPAGSNKIGIVKRFPIGPVLAITPFNFPLNLVSHKVAPALAAGNSIVLKPSSKAPMSALTLAEIAIKAGLAPSILNVVPCSSQIAQGMVKDARIRKFSFTGSAKVGWKLKALAGKKKVTLELGGNAGVIVEADSDIDMVVEKLIFGSFAYAGQVCISVQRIFVQQSVADEFIGRFVECTKKETLWGDPSEPDVICGPLIDSENVARVLRWIDEARTNGAKLLCGGEQQGSIITPAVLTEVDPRLSIAAKEAFGPVVVIERYKEFDEAIARLNDSVYGLQAAVFTNDIGKVFKAYNRIDVGGLIHNDSPSFRVDLMPYGGVKDSGEGREGIRYAILDMTEMKLLVINPL
ncbi:MAG: aldehyde dehydrogenase family protein [Thermodesulfobacteriota bacterium]|nr:aldehyde dehydrogenase family protein [Thermodesulfobacteriota bacterium]